MSNQYLKLRRSAVPGKVPDTASLDFGEIALNTHDGLAFMKISSSIGQEVIAIGGGAGDISGSTYYAAIFSGSSAVVTGSIYDSGSFTAIGATTTPHLDAPERFFVDASDTESYNLISGHGTINNYLQLNIKNFSSGNSGSSDVVATADNGDEASFFIDMGVNSSGYNSPNGIGSSNDAYLYSTAQDLLIGNASSGKRVIIFNGSGPALDNARIYINSQGTVGVNASDPTLGNPEALLVEPLVSGAIGPNDFSNLIVGRGRINENYLQLNLTNLGSGSAASTDIVATNDIGDEASYYIDMGVNSSNYSVPNAVGIGNDAYLYSTARHLHIGNASNYPIQFFVGGIDSDANRKMQLNPNGQHELTGSIDISDSAIIRGSETITGSNGVLIYTGNASGPYPTLEEVHANDEYPWLSRFYNDSFSTTSSVMSYFGWNDGRFVFHNESTQSIGIQVNGFQAENGLLIYPDKVAFVNNVEVTGSVYALSITGSLFGTASWAENASSSSISANALTSSLALTASSADDFVVRNSLTASNALITGTITAQTLVVQTVTSSVVYSSGSNNFGSQLTDKQTFTGSVNITGSLTVNGYTAVTSNMTGSMSVATASFAQTASYVLNAVSASYSFTASSAISASQAQTASYILNAISSSYAFTASSAISASQAQTASYALSTIPVFPYTGSAIISGSLTVTGSSYFSDNVYIGSGPSAPLGQQSKILYLGAYGGIYNIYDNNGYLRFDALQTILSAQNATQIRAANNSGISILAGYGTIIGTGTEASMNSSAKLQVESTTKGFLPTRTDLTSNISSPAQGLITYLTGSTNEGLWYYDSGSIKGWTRLLNNSGSQVISGSLTVTQGITGSLFGTASWAQNAVTASYVPAAGSNTQIQYNSSGSLGASSGFTYDNSTGGVAITNTAGGIPTPAISFVTSTYNSAIIAGNSTYPYAGTANSFNFYHAVSGPFTFYNGGISPTRRMTILADGKVIVGSATSATRTFEVNATSNTDGIQLNSTSPNTSININHTATSANVWGINSAGSGATQTAGTLSIGSVSTNNILLHPNGNTVLGAISSSDAGFKHDVQGTGRYTNNLTVTGSVTATTGFTGSLFGTASWAQNSLTASYALNVSGTIANAVSASYAFTASSAISSSQAQTASYVLNAISSSYAYTASSAISAFTASSAISSSLSISSSYAFTASSAVSSSYALTASYVANASSFPYTGSAVISGSLLVTGSASIQSLNIGASQFNNTSSVTSAGTTIVSVLPTSSYTSCFYNYTITSGSNARSGQVMSVWNGSTVRYLEVTTMDIGNTATASFAVALSGANVQLSFSSPGSWAVKNISNLL